MFLIIRRKGSYRHNPKLYIITGAAIGIHLMLAGCDMATVIHRPFKIVHHLGVRHVCIMAHDISQQLNGDVTVKIFVDHVPVAGWGLFFNLINLGHFKAFLLLRAWGRSPCVHGFNVTQLFRVCNEKVSCFEIRNKISIYFGCVFGYLLFMVIETPEKPKGLGKGNRNPHPLPPGPGRPKGSINKTSRIAKENIETVFEELGGVPAMVAWAADNLTEFYKHYAKLIPFVLTGDEKNPVAVKDVTDIKSKLLKAIPEDQLNAIIATAGDNNGGSTGGTGTP